jgi:hypothetical protein
MYTPGAAFSCGVRAVILAVKAGYTDDAHLKKDADLDPLRGRDDFRKRLQELGKKSTPGPEKKP